jgi:hypothetical protein
MPGDSSSGSVSRGGGLRCDPFIGGAEVLLLLLSKTEIAVATDPLGVSAGLSTVGLRIGSWGFWEGGADGRGGSLGISLDGAGSDEEAEVVRARRGGGGGARLTASLRTLGLLARDGASGLEGFFSVNQLCLRVTHHSSAL